MHRVVKLTSVCLQISFQGGVTLNVNGIYLTGWESRVNKMERRRTLTGVSAFILVPRLLPGGEKFSDTCSSLMMLCLMEAPEQ